MPSPDWQRVWYSSAHPLATALAPVSWLFAAVAALRTACYRRGWLRSVQVAAPVIVVGNITVGGTGKTPLVALLVERLRAAGLRPGIITRGYGGHAQGWPVSVDADSDPRLVGDEAVMLAGRCGCPLVAAPDRVQAAERLLATTDCDVVVSDDGLQHLRLARQVEIAVVDGQRHFGNGRRLPAGPLRDSPARLRSVDLVLENGSEAALGFALRPDAFVHLDGSRADLTSFAGRPVDAIAGIGNPERFFTTLRGLGCQVRATPFPDHHPFTAEDLAAFGERPLVMTEKDAVKVRRLSHPRDSWYLRVSASPTAAASAALTALLARVRKDSGTPAAPSP